MGEKTIQKSPQVKETKLLDLQKRIDRGEYKIKPDQIADKILKVVFKR